MLYILCMKFGRDWVQIEREIRGGPIHTETRKQLSANTATTTTQSEIRTEIRELGTSTQSRHQPPISGLAGWCSLLVWKKARVPLFGFDRYKVIDHCYVQILKGQTSTTASVKITLLYIKANPPSKLYLFFFSHKPWTHAVGTVARPGLQIRGFFFHILFQILELFTRFCPRLE